MSKTDPNDAAFPAYAPRHGLTKREWFAGMALAGLLTQYEGTDRAVTNAIWQADALIEALNREGPA